MPDDEQSPSRDAIAQHSDFDPDDVEWVTPEPHPAPIEIVDYDPAWPDRYAVIAERIRAALGDRVLALDHVGSTSVPGLPAKAIIDVDLTVADNSDEDAYRADLESAGTVLRLREPGWHQHRLFLAVDPVANIHVWGPGSPEAVRHRMFRDWLIEHDDDRALYVAAKRSAAAAVRASGESMQTYNQHKEETIRAILDRLFSARGVTGA
jgi:GrpB-like predicted nucleotidyltransferase (UPF0157 family)